MCGEQAKCGVSAHYSLLGAIVRVYGTSSHDEEGDSLDMCVGMLALRWSYVAKISIMTVFLVYD